MSGKKAEAGKQFAEGKTADGLVSPQQDDVVAVVAVADRFHTDTAIVVRYTADCTDEEEGKQDEGEEVVEGVLAGFGVFHPHVKVDIMQ